MEELEMVVRALVGRGRMRRKAWDFGFSSTLGQSFENRRMAGNNNTKPSQNHGWIVTPSTLPLNNFTHESITNVVFQSRALVSGNLCSLLTSVLTPNQRPKQECVGTNATNGFPAGTQGPPSPSCALRSVGTNARLHSWLQASSLEKDYAQFALLPAEMQSLTRQDQTRRKWRRERSRSGGSRKRLEKPTDE